MRVLSPAAQRLMLQLCFNASTQKQAVRTQADFIDQLRSAAPSDVDMVAAVEVLEQWNTGISATFAKFTGLGDGQTPFHAQEWTSEQGRQAISDIFGSSEPTTRKYAVDDRETRLWEFGIGLVHPLPELNDPKLYWEEAGGDDLNGHYFKTFVVNELGEGASLRARSADELPPAPDGLEWRSSGQRYRFYLEKLSVEPKRGDDPK